MGFYSNYASGLNVWKNLGYDDLGAVMPGEFDRYRALGNDILYCPNQVLDQQDLLPDGSPDPLLRNRYVGDYRDRAAEFARAMISAGMKRFWIWNEPNVIDAGNPGQNCDPNRQDALSPEVFATLVYKSCFRIRERFPEGTNPDDIHLYSGSLVITEESGSVTNLENYLRKMYAHLRQYGVGPGARPYSWNGLSFNLLGQLTDGFVTSVRTMIRAVLADPEIQHEAEVICGEWGTRDDQFPNQSQRLAMFQALVREFPTMYFYAHQQEIASDPDSFGARRYCHGGTDGCPGTDPYVLREAMRWYGPLQNELYPLAP